MLTLTNPQQTTNLITPLSRQKVGLVHHLLCMFCIFLSLETFAKEPPGSRAQPIVWIEFERVPDGFIFEGTNQYIADQGEWYESAWNIKRLKTLETTKWWTIFPKRVRIGQRDVDVGGIEDPDPTELPHLRVKLPPGDSHVLAAMTIRNRYGNEFTTKPLTIKLRPNTALIIVRPEFEPVLTSQIKAHERFCLARSQSERCLEQGQVFIGAYVVRYRPGQRAPTGLSCTFAFEATCDVVEQDRFREQDVYKTCRDQSVQVACPQVVQANSGTVTVVHLAKVVKFGPERVRLCSVFGCTQTYVGGSVHVIPGATGVGRYEFK